MLTLEDFKPHLEKTFKVRDGRHAFALVEITEHPVAEADRARINRLPFTLIFRGPPGDVLPAGLFTFDVDGADASYELYVMPIHTPVPAGRTTRRRSTRFNRRLSRSSGRTPG